jgi:hypothetical protein
MSGAMVRTPNSVSLTGNNHAMDDLLLFVLAASV